MKSTRSGLVMAALYILCIGSQSILLQSCKKEATEEENQYLSVNLPSAELRNESYYLLNYMERSVALDFGQTIDSSTIEGNIFLMDRDGSLDTIFRTISQGRKVILALKPGYQLQDGWKYLITIHTGLRSVTGVTLPAPKVIEIRTSSRPLGLDTGTASRNSIICISDIHMGDPRALSFGYSWFSKNAVALESLLDVALTNPEVRQVVILGDLFDGWVVPYRISPIDSASGIHNTRDYFLAIANAAPNAGVIQKLRAIAAGGVVGLVYIPGNHDMLLTQDILLEIIPGITWQGDANGLGHYSPLQEIIMEHGHRYDFFNCPQPLVNPGHILPPGYFISRLDAQGLMDGRSRSDRWLKSADGEAEFLTAWTAAFTYLQVKYNMTVAPDSANIRMGGMDGYFNSFSFNAVRDMYAANIEDVWPSTEAGNALPVAMPAVMAILDGSMDLSFTAAYEYMQSTAPRLYKIVVFGHTHNPMLKVYPTGKQYTGIYANTGSWVNPELSSKAVRTFVVIKPGEWTGSDLDVVSLFQYNLDSGSGAPDPDYIPVLISEESIVR